MYKDTSPAVCTRLSCKLQSNHDYPERLVQLKLESLELRRLYKDMTMVYTIVHNLTSSNDDVLLLYIVIIITIIFQPEDMRLNFLN